MSDFIVLITIFSSFSIFANTTSPKCPGENGEVWVNDRHRNPRDGGFVGDGTDVAESVFIAKSAAICGSASVQDKARIYGNAVIKNYAYISGEAKIFGNAIIKDSAIIEGKARVFEDALIGGDTLLSGNIQVRGRSVLNTGVYERGVINEGRNRINEILTELKNLFENRVFTYSNSAAAKYETILNFDFNQWGNNCLVNLSRKLIFYKFEETSSSLEKEQTVISKINRLDFSKNIDFTIRDLSNSKYDIEISSTSTDLAIFEYAYDASDILFSSSKKKENALQFIAFGSSNNDAQSLVELLKELEQKCQ